MMRLDDVVRNSIHITDWIKAQSLHSFTRSQLTTAMRHNDKINKEMIDKVINELTERNILQAIEQAGKGTKPVTHYYVNPTLLE